jgi:hypothetical protein
MGMLHVQQHTSSVFYPLVYLIYKAVKELGVEWCGSVAANNQTFSHCAVCKTVRQPCNRKA